MVLILKHETLVGSVIPVISCSTLLHMVAEAVEPDMTLLEVVSRLRTFILVGYGIMLVIAVETN